MEDNDRATAIQSAKSKIKDIKDENNNEKKDEQYSMVANLIRQVGIHKGFIKQGRKKIVSVDTKNKHKTQHDAKDKVLEAWKTHVNFDDKDVKRKIAEKNKPKRSANPKQPANPKKPAKPKKPTKEKSDIEKQRDGIKQNLTTKKITLTQESINSHIEKLLPILRKLKEQIYNDENNKLYVAADITNQGKNANPSRMNDEWLQKKTNADEYNKMKRLIMDIHSRLRKFIQVYDEKRWALTDTIKEAKYEVPESRGNNRHNKKE